MLAVALLLGLLIVVPLIWLGVSGLRRRRRGGTSPRLHNVSAAIRQARRDAEVHRQMTDYRQK
jgi:hypothetical protein